MSKAEVVTYTRKRHVIYAANGSVHQSYPSVGAAKKASWMLQKQGNKVIVDHTADPKPLPAYKAALKTPPINRQQAERRKRLDAPENSIRDRVRKQLGVEA